MAKQKVKKIRTLKGSEFVKLIRELVEREVGEAYEDGWHHAKMDPKWMNIGWKLRSDKIIERIATMLDQRIVVNEYDLRERLEDYRNGKLELKTTFLMELLGELKSVSF